jgi:DNA repair exonuclease SbcCD ATPase subunit
MVRMCVIELFPIIEAADDLNLCVLLSQEAESETLSTVNKSLEVELAAASQNIECFEKQESEILERYENLEVSLTTAEAELQETKHRIKEIEKAEVERSRTRWFRRFFEIYVNCFEHHPGACSETI